MIEHQVSQPPAVREAWARLLSRHVGAVFWSADAGLRVVGLHGAPAECQAVAAALHLDDLATLAASGDDSPVAEAHRRALTGETCGLTVEHEGSVLLVHLEPLDAAGNGVVGLAVDVTLRRELLAQLRQRERELASMAAHSPDTITRYDREHRVQFMSAAVERATGIPPEAFQGRTLREMGFPEDLVSHWEAVTERVFASGRSEETEWSFVGVDGVARTYHTRAVPERDEADRLTHVLTTTRDITDRVRAEREARAADATLRRLFEQSLTGIYIIQEGRFVLVNPRLATIFGYASPDEVHGLPVSALVHPDDAPTVTGNLQRRLDGDTRTLHYGFRGARRDGSVVHVEVFGGVAEHDGRPAIVGTLLDVTENVQARAALAESEERFRALVEHSTDLIAILEPDGALRYASPSHEQLLGLGAPHEGGPRLAREELLRYLHPDDLETAREAFSTALAEGSAQTVRPVRVRHQDGSWRSLSVVFTDMRGSSAVQGVVANARDVTEQHLLETQLREVQKLEAIGRLAGGVAHDFNNILAAISGYSQLLRETLDADDPRVADVDEILAASARGAGVARQLLAFSRRQALETEVLDLAGVVRELGRMLRSLLPASIALELPPPERTVWVRAVRPQVEQIVMNLAVNARDAMPRGGRLALDVGVRSTGSGAPHAVFTVRDSGIGMSPEVRARVFEPFFTTKPLGQGTGLGLATVFGLVRQFGGTIEVQSEEGRGSTFEVTLPIVPAPPTSRTDGAEDAAPAVRSSARILVVEDEPQVRDIARRILHRAGFAVTEAADGTEALERLLAGEAVDLVLTDAAMPGISGWELATRVSSLRPSLPVVLMSGYAELSGGDDPAAAHIRAFLEKPFTNARLIEVVSEALAG